LYKIYREAASKEATAGGRNLDKPIGHEIKRGVSTQVVLTNLIPTRRVVNGKTFTDYQMVLTDGFGDQAHTWVSGPDWPDAMRLASTGETGHDFPIMEIIGCQFKVEMGPGPGTVIQRIHGSRFVAMDVETGEVYDQDWPTYSAAERACEEAGLTLSVPMVRRWINDPANFEYNRQRLGLN
jgi:hypothetical protein